MIDARTSLIVDRCQENKIECPLLAIGLEVVPRFLYPDDIGFASICRSVGGEVEVGFHLAVECCRSCKERGVVVVPSPGE